MIKTLIGKNNYLFLINDACRELEVHCDNLNLVKDKTLAKYDVKNFLLIVFPNKSLIYKNYLPDEYVFKYRPALNDYSKIFNEKIIDSYEVLKNENDVYYKTDTHINLKGNYIVYKYFIKKINEIYKLNLISREIDIECKECVLTDLKCGIGDLLWHSNLGDQKVEEKKDTYYYSNNIKNYYYNHVIDKNDDLRILSKELVDKNEQLEGKLISWEILSENILHKKNISNNKFKIIIFYDSFLILALDLYLELFEEIYMIKDIYNKQFIDKIKPDYVFEFRVERFLM
jgi:hypothetical protein